MDCWLVVSMLICVFVSLVGLALCYMRRWSVFVVVSVVVDVGCCCSWLLVVLVFGCSIVVSASCVVMFLFVHA